MAKKEDKKLINRLRSKYRLSVLKEASYEERFSMLLSPLNVLILFIIAFIVIGGIVYSTVAFTPLKEYVIPGYSDEEMKAQAFQAQMIADSTEIIADRNDKYLAILSAVLNGKLNLDSLTFDRPEWIDDGELSYFITERDSILRARIAEEDRFSLNMADSNKKNDVPTTLFLFKPLDGTISSGFDASIEHFGVDIVAPSNSVVKAVLGGTVIEASYSSNGGNIIVLQHPNNLLSLYKHNSALFKKVGDQVKAGESIAVIGNTGDHTDGPHLHFELWDSGIPIDPAGYFASAE